MSEPSRIIDPASPLTDEPGPIVTLGDGTLQGCSREGIASFKGIPFAAPPVGALRWRPPQAAAAWSGVRSAAEFGPDCAQEPFPADAAPLSVSVAEDCLYVNVWPPAAFAGKKLPVMVWIYGGGFVNGGSSPRVYDGSAFARDGVVFVSFNYRIGRFGFFAHPALTAEHPSEPHGNYGYMDQIAALQWVQRNIAAFGGDPGNVTVFGESAGGGSVVMMLTSPLTQGLFHRVIIQSGGGLNFLMGERHLNKRATDNSPSAEEIGVSFAQSAGITGSDPEALAALRRLPASAIVAGLNISNLQAEQLHAGPMLDGKIVIETPARAYAEGRGASVPVIVGATSDDLGFPSAADKPELFAAFGAEAGKAAEAYDPAGAASVVEVATTIAADRMMVQPVRDIARAIANAGQPAFVYRFSYVAESERSNWPGAPHASEIPYVFDTLAARYGEEVVAADQATATTAHTYWVNFAKSGNPNGPGLTIWNSYNSDADEILDFTMDGPKFRCDPWKDRLDLIERHK